MRAVWPAGPCAFDAVFAVRREPRMSRIVEFTSYGGPEVLKFKDIPDPKPAANEMRIRVKAIGLNRAESMWRHRKYIEPVNLPARLGHEAAGAVDALGEWVLGFGIGGRVHGV